MELSKEIIGIIKKTKPLYVPVNEQSDLYKDLGFDSLEFIQLIVNVEEAYTIRFDLLEIDACRRIDNLIKLVEHKSEETTT